MLKYLLMSAFVITVFASVAPVIADEGAMDKNMAMSDKPMDAMDGKKDMDAMKEKAALGDKMDGKDHNVHHHKMHDKMDSKMMDSKPMMEDSSKEALSEVQENPEHYSNTK